jgi:hypothetical protein
MLVEIHGCSRFSGNVLVFFFDRDWIVLEMATKKGLFRLLARISRVFAVIVKHTVMLLSQIWVTVGWGGILVVDHGCARHVDIYPVCTWDFHFQWLLFIFHPEDVILIFGVEHEHIKWYYWMSSYIERSGENVLSVRWRDQLHCHVIRCTQWSKDAWCNQTEHLNDTKTQINFGLTSAAWFEHLIERNSLLGPFP